MRKFMFFLLFALFAATSTEVLADGRHPRDRVRNGEIQPLDQILPHLRGSYPGTFYDADGPFPDGRGGYRYRIKWLTPDGRVIWLDTDARTGHVMGTDKSDRRSNNSRDNDSRQFNSSSRDRDARDPFGRDRRDDEDNARRDRPSVNPWDRGDRRDREDNDRSRSDRRHNDNNNERFNRSSRDNPGRNNWPGNDRHRGR